MITCMILALTVSGRFLCSSEPMRVHEELLINSTVLRQLFRNVEVSADDSTLRNTVNVTGYVVNATPNWEKTEIVDRLVFMDEYVKKQDYRHHSFRLVNRSKVHITVQTTRIDGTGVGNLSAAFFFLDDNNYQLYTSGSNYTPITGHNDAGIGPVQAMPSFFAATLVANASAALYHAILENNDYIDMTADWNITIERTKFNISSVPVSASCFFLMNNTEREKEKKDNGDPSAKICTLNVTDQEDYFVVVTADGLTASQSSRDVGRVSVSTRGVFMGVWRFTAFGVITVLSAILFIVTCFVAFCYRRPTGVPGRKITINSDEDDDESYLPVLQGTIPEIRALEPSPPPSP